MYVFAKERIGILVSVFQQVSKIFFFLILIIVEIPSLIVSKIFILFEYPAACCGWDGATAERR